MPPPSRRGTFYSYFVFSRSALSILCDFAGAGLLEDTRCFGPLVTAASTACSNRFHAPGSVSISFKFCLGFFAMDIDAKRPSKDHFRALGECIWTWSLAEFFLTHALCSLITENGEFHKTDTTIAIVTIGMSSTTTIGLMRTLAKERYPDDAKAFGKFCDALIKAKKTRDMFAHAVWSQPPKSDKIEPALIKTVGSLRRVTGTFSVDDIEAFTLSINQMIQQLVGFLYRWGLNPPLPEKDE